MRTRELRWAKVVRIPVLGMCGAVAAAILAAAAFAGGEPHPHGICLETVNPAANPAVGDNGGSDPNDPFGGDAVPGGTSTTPGSKGNGPINPDGFYLVGGLLFSDTTLIEFPGAGDAWPAYTTVKYVEWGNPTIRITTAIGGPKSAITYMIHAPGDLYVNAPKDAVGAVFCGVPPPPF